MAAVSSDRTDSWGWGLDEFLSPAPPPSLNNQHPPSVGGVGAFSAGAGMAARERQMVDVFNDAICQIRRDGQPKGTGFLVGPNVIITNNHVFTDIKEVERYHAVFTREIRAYNSTWFNIFPVKFISKPENFFCSEHPFNENNKQIKDISSDRLDYSIVVLEQKPALSCRRYVSLFHKAIISECASSSTQAESAPFEKPLLDRDDLAMEISRLAEIKENERLLLLHCPDIPVDLYEHILKAEPRAVSGNILSVSPEGYEIRYSNLAKGGSSGGLGLNQAGKPLSLHYVGGISTGSTSDVWIKSEDPKCTAGIPLETIVKDLAQQRQGETEPRLLSLKKLIEESIAFYRSDLATQLEQVQTKLSTTSDTLTVLPDRSAVLSITSDNESLITENSEFCRQNIERLSHLILNNPIIFQEKKLLRCSLKRLCENFEFLWLSCILKNRGLGTYASTRAQDLQQVLDKNRNSLEGDLTFQFEYSIDLIAGLANNLNLPIFLPKEDKDMINYLIQLQRPDSSEYFKDKVGKLYVHAQYKYREVLVLNLLDIPFSSLLASNWADLQNTGLEQRPGFILYLIQQLAQAALECSEDETTFTKYLYGSEDQNSLSLKSLLSLPGLSSSLALSEIRLYAVQLLNKNEDSRKIPLLLHLFLDNSDRHLQTLLIRSIESCCTNYSDKLAEEINKLLEKRVAIQTSVDACGGRERIQSDYTVLNCERQNAKREHETRISRAYPSYNQEEKSKAILQQKLEEIDTQEEILLPKVIECEQLEKIEALEAWVSTSSWGPLRALE